jgi:hypothetical protein
MVQWKLLHKSGDFSTNISNFFYKKTTKISIKKVIGFGWV